MLQSLFHYKKFVPEHLVSLLTERKIKLSRPDNFNDPWDCRAHYKVPLNQEEIDHVAEWLLNAHRKRDPFVSEIDRVARARQLLSPERMKATFEEIEQKMYLGICKEYRVYCLSEIPNSPLMWAHYANSHTGICLEFDAKKAPFTRATGATNIIYLEAYPELDLPNSGYEVLINKSIHWSYEAEWRLIAVEKAFVSSSNPHDVLTTDDDFLIFPPAVLKSVTIGCRADTACRSTIREMIEKHAPDVLLREAGVAPDRYELNISPPLSV